MEPKTFIFVCERGMVLVGRVRSEDTMTYVLDDVSVVRRWGTTKGIGQLALEGPLQGTTFDKEPNGTTLSKLCVYRKLPCTESKWREYGG